MNKNQLKNKHEELAKEMRVVEKELRKIFKTVTMPETKAKYENTYWVDENQYSCDNKRWLVYIHIKKILDLWEAPEGCVLGTALTNTYELSSENFLLVKFDYESGFMHFDRQITKKQFQSAVLKMLKKAEKELG